MNNVVLTGNIVRDSELRFSQSGKGVCTLSIAVNEGFGDKKTTQYFNIVSFGAENVCQYLVKGVKVAIQGRLNNSNYEKDGVKHYKTDIIANNYGGIEILSRPGDNKGNSSEKPNSSVSQEGFNEDITPVDEGDMPF